MQTKMCKKCGDLEPIDQFYRDCNRADGRMSQCKACRRLYETQGNGRLASARYRSSSKGKETKRRYRSTGRSRSAALVAQKKYRATESGARSARLAAKRARDAHPDKYVARYKLSNAVTSGRIARQPCEVCGAEKVEAHHDDYSKPLDVRWLCKKHHVEAHRCA